MKTKLFIAVLSSVILAISSCQKVIDIPLNEAEQTLVVEAVIKDAPGNNYVLLSLTGTVYATDIFEKVEDATVTVSDSEGNSYVLNHEGAGRYSSPTLQAFPGRTYFLEVVTSDRTITSSCLTQSKPTIDSLSSLLISGSFGVSADDTLYLISFHSVDNAEERNYYWVKIFRNGIENSGFYLGNDDFINGSYYEAQFFGAEADPRDTVLVEMMSVDEANYNYLIGLSNNIDSGPFSAAPANPPSNLIGNAVGFFGVYMTDTMSVILP